MGVELRRTDGVIACGAEVSAPPARGKSLTCNPNETYTVDGTDLVLNPPNQRPVMLFFSQKGNQLLLGGKTTSILEYQLGR